MTVVGWVMGDEQRQREEEDGEVWGGWRCV